MEWADYAGSMVVNRQHPLSLRSLVQQFQPAFFSITMGTGMLALLLPQLGIRLGEVAGCLLWCGNALLFVWFCVLFFLKGLWFADQFQHMVRDPGQALFLGTLPMGLATVINGLLLYGPAHWGAAVPLAAHLWMWDVLLAMGVGLWVPWTLFSHRTQRLEELTGMWLLPLVACEVAAATAGLLVPHLPEHHRLLVLCSGYALWGMSVPLALLVLGLLFLRLMQHGWPAPGQAISMFLPVGPLATGAFAILQLGTVAPLALQHTSLVSLAPVLQGVGLVGGVVLLGTATWWLLLAALSLVRFVQGGLPFTLGWWGLTFPIGAYVASVFALTHFLPWQGLQLAGNVLLVVLTGIWLLVAGKTLTSLKLFERPSSETPGPVVASTHSG